MAAEAISAADAAATIPELWLPKMLEGRYSAQVIAPRVMRVDGDVAAKGDKLHIPIEPTVTCTTVGSQGAITITDYTPEDGYVTMDAHYHSALSVEDITQRQSLVDLLKGFVPSFGKVLAKQIDETIAALYASITTNTVGASTDAVSDDLILAALQKLVSADVPIDNMNDISLILHNSRWADVKKIDKYSFSNYTGQNEGGMLRYAAPAPYGVPIYFTSAIDSSASAYQNMLIHRQTFACGVQQNFKLETLARTALTTPIVASILYGARILRETHGCLLLSKTGA